jgi:cytochrome c556
VKRTHQTVFRRSRAVAIGWLLASCFAAGCLVTSLVAAAQDGGASTAQDVIVARKVMMSTVEDCVNRIGAMISAGAIDLEAARAEANTVAVMLATLPHLFPTSSNQWTENATPDPVTGTMASPDIWANYPEFYQLAATAAKTASDLSRAENIDEVKRLHRALGTECDLCHSLYLKE